MQFPGPGRKRPREPVGTESALGIFFEWSASIVHRLSIGSAVVVEVPVLIYDSQAKHIFLSEVPS
jgi:hypothetical protein